MLGLVLGVVGAFEHEWYLFGTIPVGGVLAVLAVFGVPYAMGRLMRPAWPPAWSPSPG